MTAQSCDNRMPAMPAGFSDTRGVLCRRYRAPGFAWILRSGKASARSYFLTVRGSLLPGTATENGRARTDELQTASCEARNPVMAAEQPCQPFGMVVRIQCAFLAQVNS